MQVWKGVVIFLVCLEGLFQEVGNTLALTWVAVKLLLPQSQVMGIFQTKQPIDPYQILVLLLGSNILPQSQ